MCVGLNKETESENSFIMTISGPNRSGFFKMQSTILGGGNGQLSLMSFMDDVGIKRVGRPAWK